MAGSRAPFVQPVELRDASDNTVSLSGGAVPVTGPTGASSTTVQGTAADGAAAVGSPVQVGGKDGSGNAQAMLTDTSGRPLSSIDDTTIDDYETVAAGQTAQVLGATGATGDFLSSVLIVPATTSPGNVIILDNATSITIFTGGASSVSNLVPFSVPIGAKSVSGAWKVTTGSNVSVMGFGKFT